MNFTRETATEVYGTITKFQESFAKGYKEMAGHDLMSDTIRAKRDSEILNSIWTLSATETTPLNFKFELDRLNRIGKYEGIKRKHAEGRQ